MSTEMEVSVPVPPGVKMHVETRSLSIQGPLGKIERRFPTSAITASHRGTEVHLKLNLPLRRRTRALLLTWERHVANMVGGVTVGVEAKAKVVAAHFPMKVYTKDNYVIIENFLGEKFPRKSLIVGATRVQVEGEELHFQGVDVEEVGQSVANLERTTHIRKYDPRVFQDGIYVTTKAHLKVG